MSHFSLLVIGEVENQLKPFDENQKVEPYIDFTIEKAAAKRLADIERYKKIIEENDTKLWNIENIKKNLARLESMTPEDLFKEECQSYEIFDDNGNPLSTYNPDSKWDWWTIGGRWDCFFTLKSGEKSNSALKKDIDFEAMVKETLDSCSKNWEEAEAQLPGNSCGDDQNRYFRFGIDSESWKLGKENYLKVVKEKPLTFAILKNGVWTEKGKMGWWATVSNEKEHNQWVQLYNGILDSIGEDELMTIVDCHI